MTPVKGDEKGRAAVVSEEVSASVARCAPSDSRPVLFLAIAVGPTIDRVVRIDLGVTDPVVTPSTIGELLLRTQGARSPDAAPPPSATVTNTTRKVQFGRIVIEMDENRVFVDAKEIYLPAMEFRLLAYLVNRRGHLCQRGDILRDVWGARGATSWRTLHTHLSRLREKLGGAGLLLHTIRGVGFRLVDSASDLPAADHVQRARQSGEVQTADSQSLVPRPTAPRRAVGTRDGRILVSLGVP